MDVTGGRMGFIYNIGDPDSHEVLFRSYSLGTDHDAGAVAAMAEANAVGVTGVLLNSADASPVDTATVDRQGSYLIAITVGGTKHPSLKVVQVEGNSREAITGRAMQAVRDAGIDQAQSALQIVCPDEMEP
jgi:hypothetical protein